MHLKITPTTCALHLPAQQPHELVLVGAVWTVFIPNREHAVAKATLDATTHEQAMAEMRQMGLGEDV